MTEGISNMVYTKLYKMLKESGWRKTPTLHMVQPFWCSI